MRKRGEKNTNNNNELKREDSGPGRCCYAGGEASKRHLMQGKEEKSGESSCFDLGLYFMPAERGRKKERYGSDKRNRDFSVITPLPDVHLNP